MSRTYGRAVKRPWIIKKQRGEEKRSADYEFYNSTRWRRFRQRFLRENPLCALCFNRGIIAEAAVADHIKPIRLGGERLNAKNIQPLCKTCHAQKSGREAHL